MDIRDVRTEQDLRVYLDRQQQKLAALEEEISERRARSAARRMELAEAQIQALAKQGVPYDVAFERVTSELEAGELEARAKVDKERAERVALELEQLTEAEERLILGLDEEGS